MHRISVKAPAVRLRPRPPAWVIELFERCAITSERIDGVHGMPILSRRIERFTLSSGVIPAASSMSGPALADAVAALYRSLADEVKRQARHSVRVWNFVPDIHGALDGGDRYMTFNIGRFAAYCDWFGSADSFASALPTASAVGVAGPALSVYVLAADEPGRPVENPRQIPSYKYSRQYGVSPPCFSRATQIGSTLLIGGTASILGEHSQHEGDLDAQVRETCDNIGALIGLVTPQPAGRSLDALKSLRVHVRDPLDASDVRDMLAELVPAVQHVELVHAPLCRPELLVEIEGVAVTRING